MIKTTNMMLESLKEYANPKAKLSRMVQQGECFRLTKGLYETDRNVPGYFLAGSIYGPSYISFEYALSYHHLIPEAVHTITCATFEKKKQKRYENIFGTFTYRDVPSLAFPLELKLVQEGDYSFRIAGPEKALCDTLYSLTPVPTIRDLADLLMEDLRIDEADLLTLDVEKLAALSDRYRSRNIKKLVSLVRRMQK